MLFDAQLVFIYGLFVKYISALAESVRSAKEILDGEEESPEILATGCRYRLCLFAGML